MTEIERLIWIVAYVTTKLDDRATPQENREDRVARAFSVVTAFRKTELSEDFCDVLPNAERLWDEMKARGEL